MTLQLVRNERRALTIAEEAIIPRGATNFAMVVDSEADPVAVEERVLQLGTRIAGRVEVLAGLAADELIVTHGTLKLRPGSLVKIQAIDDGSQTIAEMLREGSGAGR